MVVFHECSENKMKIVASKTLCAPFLQTEIQEKG